MSDNRHDSGSVGDEQLLIDFVLGRCDEGASRRIRQRLEADSEFADIHGGISRTFALLGEYGTPDPPDDLADRAMARIRSARQTEALLAAQSMDGRSLLSRFSFRELIAVAAAAVLVVGILIPSMVQSQRMARRSLCADNVWAVGAALGHYANANDGSLPSSQADAQTWLYCPSGKYTSNSRGLFTLVRKSYARPGVFQCPSAKGQAFVLKEDMSDFPSPGSINYSYQYSLNVPIRRNSPELVPKAGRMAILADATPVFSGGTFRPERIKWAVSENHSGGGQNVLYLDTHVQWTRDSRVGVNGDNIWLAEGVYDYTGKEKPASVTDTFLLPHPGW